MMLKFLNKKGWHTGSLRNIENVWKAEQKHGAEQKKLEELRKEREQSEFRLLQEQAGLVPKQERLDFLYESGLAVGKSSDGFKALVDPPEAAPSAAEPSSSKAAVPGALFEDKPQSANDTWRKLHSDPLLLIRQREKEAVDRIKKNPMKMAMIKKSVEAEKKPRRDKKDKGEKKERKRKHKSKKHSSKASSDSEETTEDEKESRKRAHPTNERHHHSSSKGELSDLEDERKKRDRSKHSSRARSESKYSNGGEDKKRKGDDSKSHHEEERRKSDRSESERGLKSKESGSYAQDTRREYGYNRNRGVPKLSEEERAARLREMQLDAELHEEQRWKRLKKAAEDDAREAVRASSSSVGKNFLDDAQKSIYGTEKGGSSTIEESVRRRAYYSQGGSAAHESNAFRR